MAPTKITVKATIHAPLKNVWDCWTKPEHIMQWNQASDDWHCPGAENDLKKNGKFKIKMASRDGKMSFDFEGIYIDVDEHKYIHYKIGDGRDVEIFFNDSEDGIEIKETFEAEQIHPPEMQRIGWQSILNNFKNYVENNYK